MRTFENMENYSTIVKNHCVNIDWNRFLIVSGKTNGNRIQYMWLNKILTFNKHILHRAMYASAFSVIAYLNDMLEDSNIESLPEEQKYTISVYCIEAEPDKEILDVYIIKNIEGESNREAMNISNKYYSNNINNNNKPNEYKPRYSNVFFDIKTNNPLFDDYLHKVFYCKYNSDDTLNGSFGCTSINLGHNKFNLDDDMIKNATVNIIESMENEIYSIGIKCENREEVLNHSI